MKKLIPIFVVGIILGCLADYYSVKKKSSNGAYVYKYKNRLFVIILMIVLSVFVGLRTRYNDTGAYLHGYSMLNATSLFKTGINWLAIGSNPGNSFLNNALKYLGVSSQNYLMFYAVITVSTYIWFIRKYSDNFALSVFLFFTMGCYTFTMAAIKQCVAVAFCLVATDRAIQKKYPQFIFWVLLASTFHAYSLMYLIVPFLDFKAWSSKTYVLLLATGAVGVSLQALLGTIINITSMLGEEYTVSSFSGEGVNLFRVAVVWSPIILSFISKRFFIKNKKREINILMNLSMINAMIMFIAIFGTANYFARLANYFLIFQVISLPLCFHAFNDESQEVLLIIIVVCYLMYFYYANGIAYGGFDSIFTKISFVEYLKQLVTTY